MNMFLVFIGKVHLRLCMHVNTMVQNVVQNYHLAFPFHSARVSHWSCDGIAVALCYELWKFVMNLADVHWIIYSLCMSAFNVVSQTVFAHCKLLPVMSHTQFDTLGIIWGFCKNSMGTINFFMDIVYVCIPLKFCSVGRMQVWMVMFVKMVFFCIVGESKCFKFVWFEMHWLC